jgi:hypothetical protein
MGPFAPRLRESPLHLSDELLDRISGLWLRHALSMPTRRQAVVCEDEPSVLLALFGTPL